MEKSRLMATAFLSSESAENLIRLPNKRVALRTDDAVECDTDQYRSVACAGNHGGWVLERSRSDRKYLRGNQMNYGYVRCSTLEQASEGRSTLEDQERVIKGVVMMKGEECVEVFRDPGVSGATPLEQRPEGARMLSLLKEGDMIIAAKLDRLFRSTIDALMTVESLKARGVGVILADISPEPVTAGGGGGLFFKILAAGADFERGRIKDR